MTFFDKNMTFFDRLGQRATPEDPGASTIRSGGCGYCEKAPTGRLGWPHRAVPTSGNANMRYSKGESRPQAFSR